MKILLCKQKSKKTVYTLFKFLLTFLLVSLISSQVYFFVSSKIVPVSSTSSSLSNYSEIYLTASGNYNPENVYVFVNGEQYCRFSSGKATLKLERSSVVEIMAHEGADFEVEFENSPNVKIVSGKSVTRCTGGMNFICRSYCSE